jgi:hypothetical protein
MQPPGDIFRAGSPARVAIELLGLLHNLPGNWMGKGFNMIADTIEHRSRTHSI